jgi:hypothetical protein
MENRTSSQYSQRTEALAAKRGVLLGEIPEVLGVSARMFHGYRSGKYPISPKAWRKLEAAEAQMENSAPLRINPSWTEQGKGEPADYARPLREDRIADSHAAGLSSGFDYRKMAEIMRDAAANTRAAIEEYRALVKSHEERAATYEELAVEFERKADAESPRK